MGEHVTPGEGHISTAIAKAFASGVPEPAHQAMDYLRLTGNDAAHAAEIRMDEDSETLAAMFGLLPLCDGGDYGAVCRCTACRSRRSPGW